MTGFIEVAKKIHERLAQTALGTDAEPAYCIRLRRVGRKLRCNVISTA